ncbi:OsmC family protein [Halioxenophilus sp. WMMB6]|uniref:OsmC family protein n=1 Tax=Halioxenophilus sp. WMMB6 TaxID=3073815 RepID=UPI00295EAB8B|nr:OsmC family protein [Halioxenophilus sp. WMMB6]
MNEFPHHYPVTASVSSDSYVTLQSPGISATIESAAPAQFGGPGDRWSPETILVAAVADCFLLSFKAIATASRFEWLALECSVDGVLDKVERTIRFTEMHIKAKLTVAEGTPVEKATKLLEKAEQHCLVSNSLSSQVHLESEVIFS